MPIMAAVDADMSSNWAARCSARWRRTVSHEAMTKENDVLSAVACWTVKGRGWSKRRMDECVGML